MSELKNTLVSASLERTALEAFRTDCIRRLKDSDLIHFSEVHQFHGELNKNWVIRESAEFSDSFATIVDEAFSSGSMRFTAEGIFDGVAYDCSFDFICGLKTRWTLFCPSESPDPVIRRIGSLVDALFELAASKEHDAEQAAT